MTTTQPHAGQLGLDLGLDQRAADIAMIHAATGIYTVAPEIEALLDGLRWPSEGQRLLDPGAGNGGFLVAALRRLPLARDDADQAVRRVRGYEFYPGAAADARRAIRDHLASRGWSPAAAGDAANRIIETRDYLLDPVPEGEFDTIAANPPYWRLANLPPGYRADYEAIVPPHARADLLYAYLQKSRDIAAPGARIGVITADRWLLNAGSSELRRQIGTRFSVTGVRRLNADSAFYRPKARRKGTPPRVHPVSIILAPGNAGRTLDARPFRLASGLPAEGVPLADLARIRLAPWLGPDGIFTVGSTRGLPRDHLVPIAEPRDIAGGELRPARRWALVTGPAEPPPAVLAHLDAALHRMPPGGRRNPRWLPPETFAGRLPLPCDAVLVPRIAKHLRAVRLPAGRLPVNHQLVVVSGLPAEAVLRMLDDPAVREQADELALAVDGGYRSYTATLLRQLVIPEHCVPEAAARP